MLREWHREGTRQRPGVALPLLPQVARGAPALSAEPGDLRRPGRAPTGSRVEGPVENLARSRAEGHRVEADVPDVVSRAPRSRASADHQRRMAARVPVRPVAEAEMPIAGGRGARA